MFVVDYHMSTFDNDQGGMKRLRESDVLDGFPSDPKRRRFDKTLPDEDEREAEGVLHRCIQWLLNLNPQNRPRSLCSLKNGLRDVCNLSFTVDPQVVFTHLLLNGLIGLEGNRVVFKEIVPTGNFQIFVPSDPFLQQGMDTRVSSDFSEALSKATNWIRHNRGFSAGSSIAVESFLHSLAQICLFKRKVSPDKVVEHFRVRGLLGFFPNGSIDYSNLPTELARPSHYMAFAH